MTTLNRSAFAKLNISTVLIVLLLQSQIQALVISSAESHPSATVKLSPREVDDYHQERAKKFSLAWKNSNGAEGNDFLTELLSVRRLESAIDEAESAYKRVSDAGKLLRKGPRRAGKPLAGFLRGRRTQSLEEMKREPSLRMDQALEEELNYANQLAAGIITDLRSILGDIQRDPSDPDRLLRLS